MAHFLDPRSDLVFKRIFGEHPEILRNFLNGMLPFADESQYIASLEYLPSEQVPDIPIIKNSIVDVRCKDASGRQFIVEMQMQWTGSFLQRVLFNASKAYVRQLEKSESYDLLCPVWGLSLLDATFDADPDAYYHDYQIVETGNPQRVLEGLRLIFVELPKYRETNPQDARKLRWAWLKFLREAGDAGSQGHLSVEEFSAQVGINEPLRQALGIAKECGFTREQLALYDGFWDAVRIERSLLSGKFAEGKAEGLVEGKAEGKAEGLAEGKAEGKAEALLAAAAGMKAARIPAETIALITGLPMEEMGVEN